MAKQFETAEDAIIEMYHTLMNGNDKLREAYRFLRLNDLSVGEDWEEAEPLITIEAHSPEDASYAQCVQELINTFLAAPESHVYKGGEPSWRHLT